MQSGILFVTVAAALLQSSYASEVHIKMPYLSSAGVTYINNVDPQSLTYAVPAKIETEHVGYAAAQIPTLTAVPYIKHLPTVSHVPVTKYEAQPAVLEKQLDVLKPAVSTRKYEVRRPAIQKQFYDIERRVIVRPVGSAVVELDQPTVKYQKGPAIIEPLHPSVFPQPIPQQEGPIDYVPSNMYPQTDNNDNVVIDNPEIRKALNTSQFLKFGQRTNFNQDPLVIRDPSPSLIASPKSTSEQDKENQKRLFEILTAQGDVAYDPNGLAQIAIDGVTNDKARVLSADSAPSDVEPSQEHVSTRRVVLARPIETYREENVVEPATKIERVSVHEPTLIKTARLDHVQVHSSVPVIGKTYAPSLAHAAIPLYQKTISPAYEYSH